MLLSTQVVAQTCDNTCSGDTFRVQDCSDEAQPVLVPAAALLNSPTTPQVIPSPSNGWVDIELNNVRLLHDNNSPEIRTLLIDFSNTTVLPGDGRYQIDTIFSVQTSTLQDTVTYSVTHADGTAVVEVTQVDPNGGNTFEFTVGSFSFDAGVGSLVINNTDPSGSNPVGFAIAQELRITPLDQGLIDGLPGTYSPMRVVFSVVG